jgi:cadmium resistance protein CadD (predicted permease)
MENLILGHSLGSQASEITKFIGMEILHWFTDVTMFLGVLIIVLGAWILWTGEGKGEEEQKQEVWEVLKADIMRGDDETDMEKREGREERKRWLLERLASLKVCGF